MEVDGATVTGIFNASNLTIRNDVYLRGEGEFHDVFFLSATIGRHLQLQGSYYSGRVDLSESSIGSLLLWRGPSPSGRTPAQDAEWGAGAILVLRNADVGALQARMAPATEWSISGHENEGDACRYVVNHDGAGDVQPRWPDSWTREDGCRLPADLTGLRYHRLGGLFSDAGEDLAQIDADALIAWVRDTRLPGMSGYRPQPYQALETALGEMGAKQAATEVAYARLIHRTNTRISASFRTDPESWVRQALTKAFDRFLQFTVGFGVYPQRAFYWFVLFVAVGTFFARRCAGLCKAGATKATWGDSLFYSLENAIPLMEPSKDFADVVHDGLWSRMFFNTQKVLGFVLATVLIGALTLGS
jgi:hypothetical protein